MLYDPKWEKIYTTENLASWLSQQPRWKRYNYGNHKDCAIAQYCRAHGVVYRVDQSVERGWEDIAQGAWTFGGAARRARRVVRRQRFSHAIHSLFGRAALASTECGES